MKSCCNTVIRLESFHLNMKKFKKQNYKYLLNSLLNRCRIHSDSQSQDLLKIVIPVGVHCTSKFIVSELRHLVYYAPQKWLIRKTKIEEKKNCANKTDTKRKLLSLNSKKKANEKKQMFVSFRLYDICRRFFFRAIVGKCTRMLYLENNIILSVIFAIVKCLQWI